MNKQDPLYKEDLKIVVDIPGIETLKGKRFLITGATGLIGVCLIDALMACDEQGLDIIIYAVGRSKEKAKICLGEYFENSHFRFIEQDVREPFPNDLVVDYIVPLASNTHPLAYSHYPIETIEINVKGAEYALKKALQCSAMVLYPSTVEVYGNAKGDDCFDEEYTGILSLSNARSCYTESKRVSEALCQSYIAEKGVNVKIVRLCRVFGPTMQMSDSKASSQFIKKALTGEDIVLKSKGDQFFSYIYVADAVSAMLYVLIHGRNGIAYNVSNEKCNVHLREFAESCASYGGVDIVFDLPSEEEKKGYSIASQAILDNTRLKSTGWVPHFVMQDAIRRTLHILKQE